MSIYTERFRNALQVEVNFFSETNNSELFCITCAIPRCNISIGNIRVDYIQN